MKPASSTPSWRPTLRPGFALAAIAALALLAAPGVPAARAEDTFRFKSEAGPGFTALPTSLPECWSDPSGVFARNGSGERGSVDADISPFGGCEEGWGSIIFWGQKLEMVWGTSPHEEWLGGYVGFRFEARDPVVGTATLSCPSEWYERFTEFGIAKLETMVSEVDGTTCTVEWLPGDAPESATGSTVGRPSPTYSRFVDSLASISTDDAGVMVQVFGREQHRVEDAITLRTSSGRLIGRTTASLRADAKEKRVDVPLDPATRRALTRHGFLVVRASIHPVDGSPGDGDSTSQLVLH
jgi:hypothetical protein